MLSGLLERSFSLAVVKPCAGEVGRRGGWLMWHQEQAGLVFAVVSGPFSSVPEPGLEAGVN